MTKKQLIEKIVNKEVKSVSFKLEYGYSGDDVLVKVGSEKLVLKSYKSYEDLKELLLANDYLHSTNFYNSNNIVFLRK